MSITAKKWSLRLVAVLLLPIFIIGIVFALPQTIKGDQAVYAAGVSGVTDTGNKVPNRADGQANISDVVRIYDGANYLVDFSQILNSTNPNTVSATVGNVTNPVGDNYRSYNRGPSNTSQGEALAYTNHVEKNTGGGLTNAADRRRAIATVQTWVNIGDNLKNAILQNKVTELNVTVGYGMTVQTSYGGISSRQQNGEAYIDFGLNRIDNISSYNHNVGNIFDPARGSENRLKNNLASADVLYRTSRDRIQSSNNTDGDGENGGFSYGVFDSLFRVHRNDTTNAETNTFHTQEVALHNTGKLTEIANNGGFWVILIAHASGGSSSPGYTVRANAALEGVKLTANIAREQANPVAHNEMMSTYGQLLSSVKLSDGWQWVNASDSFLYLGKINYPAIYTPADLVNFCQVIKNVTVFVGTVDPVVPPLQSFEAKYGQTLADLVFDNPLFSWKESVNPLTTPVGNVRDYPYVFSAEYKPVELYYSSVIVNISVLVKKAQLTTDMWTLPEIDNQYIGTTLGEISLPTGWSFVGNLNTTITELGLNEFEVIYRSGNPNYFDLEPQSIKIYAIAPIPTDLPSFAGAIDLSDKEVFSSGVLGEIDLSAWKGDGYIWEWVDPDMKIESDTEYEVQIKRVYDEEYEGTRDEEPFTIKITTTFGELNATGDGKGNLSAGLGTGVIVAGVACGVSAVAAIFLVTRGMIARRRRKKFGC